MGSHTLLARYGRSAAGWTSSLTSSSITPGCMQAQSACGLLYEADEPDKEAEEARVLAELGKALHAHGSMSFTSNEQPSPCLRFGQQRSGLTSGPLEGGLERPMISPLCPSASFDAEAIPVDPASSAMRDAKLARARAEAAAKDLIAPRLHGQQSGDNGIARIPQYRPRQVSLSFPTTSTADEPSPKCVSREADPIITAQALGCASPRAAAAASPPTGRIQVVVSDPSPEVGYSKQSITSPVSPCTSLDEKSSRLGRGVQQAGRNVGSNARSAKRKMINKINLVSPNIRNVPKCRLNPRNSTFLPYWDTFVAFVLIYTALMTPYEIAFMEPSPEFTLSLFVEPNFVLNRITDIVFVIDIVLQFFIMVPHSKPILVIKPLKIKLRGFIKRSISTTREGELITSMRGIALNYLRTWFLVDAISVAAGWIRFVEMLRTMRCLRLVKMLRLAKTSRTYERLKSSIALDYSMQTILGCMFTYLVAAHCKFSAADLPATGTLAKALMIDSRAFAGFACILMLTASFSPSPIVTFLGAKGYCIIRPWDDGHDSNDHHGFLGQLVQGNHTNGLPFGHAWELQPEVPDLEEINAEGAVWCKHGTEMWLSLFYWMIMLISGASGGDTNREDMLPGEQAAMTLIVIASALIWTMVIGNFVDVLANMNPEESRFKQRMDKLNRYCRQHRLDGDTRRRLREFMYRTRRKDIDDDDRQLILSMSPKLQGELELQVNGRWLASVSFLQGIEPDCLLRIAIALRTKVFAPTEELPGDSLYYLCSGSAALEGTLVVSGSCWGEDCILERADLRRDGARAATYAEVSCIHRDELLEIVNKRDRYGSAYPVAVRKLRWAAVSVAVKGMAMTSKYSPDAVMSEASQWDALVGGRQKGSKTGAYRPPPNAGDAAPSGRAPSLVRAKTQELSLSALTGAVNPSTPKPRSRRLSSLAPAAAELSTDLPEADTQARPDPGEASGRGEGRRSKAWVRKKSPRRRSSSKHESRTRTDPNAPRRTPSADDELFDFRTR